MLIHRTRVFDLYTTSTSAPRAPFEYIVHRGSCAALLLDPTESVGLLPHHREAIGKTLYEVPAGTLDYDASIEDIMTSEVREETGITVRDDQLRRLTSLFASPGYTSELLTLFVVKVTAAQRKATDALRWFTIPELLELIRDGEITDMKTVAAICSYQAIFSKTGDRTT
jgi:ADP-ribose pyrophosphatase